FPVAPPDSCSRSALAARLSGKVAPMVARSSPLASLSSTAPQVTAIALEEGVAREAELGATPHVERPHAPPAGQPALPQCPEHVLHDGSPGRAARVTGGGRPVRDERAPGREQAIRPLQAVAPDMVEHGRDAARARRAHALEDILAAIVDEH